MFAASLIKGSPISENVFLITEPQIERALKVLLMLETFPPCPARATKEFIRIKMFLISDVSRMSSFGPKIVGLDASFTLILNREWGQFTLQSASIEFLKRCKELLQLNVVSPGNRLEIDEAF